MDQSTHVYFYGWVDGALAAMRVTQAGVETLLGVPCEVPAFVVTFRKVESALRDLNVRTNLNVISAPTAARLRQFDSETLVDLIARNPWNASPSAVKRALRIVRSIES